VQGNRGGGQTVHMQVQYTVIKYRKYKGSEEEIKQYACRYSTQF
jgi:hypothetical protein